MKKDKKPQYFRRRKNPKAMIKATERAHKQEKMLKEVAWFVRKYIDNEENLPLFTAKLCPDSLTNILKRCIEMGMTFTWEGDDEK